MTELEETLKSLVQHVPGASFAAVAGMDGLVVEQVPSNVEPLPEAVAEWTSIVAIARRTMEDLLSAGKVEHVSLNAAGLSVSIWSVDEDFYCLVASREEFDPAVTRPAAQAAVDRIREALTTPSWPEGTV